MRLESNTDRKPELIVSILMASMDNPNEVIDSVDFGHEASTLSSDKFNAAIKL